MRIISSKILLIVLLLFNSPSIANSFTPTDGCNSEVSSQQRNKILWGVNLTGIGVITVWGMANWDYFSTSPTSKSEGWFQNDTAYGGADKLGHIYSSYVITHGLSSLYDSWCFNNDDAAMYGALSSLAIVGYIEFGDSFSEFGFSKEDMIANTIGIIYGYFSYKDTRLGNILDLRWEYKPNSDTFGDFTTDYENSKYLLALKLNGFDFSHSSFLKHIEFHAGYYTRGFSDPDATKERNVFIGIGLNLTDFFRRRSYNKTATLFKYYQIPGTGLYKEKDLND